MPRGDGQGPMGMGPMTGRGAGFCAGFATPGFNNPMMGRGCGRGGRGFGRGGGGFGGGFGRGGFGRGGWGMPAALPGAAAPTATPADQAALLKAQADHLTEALAAVQQRLAELEGDKAQ